MSFREQTRVQSSSLIDSCVCTCLSVWGLEYSWTSGVQTLRLEKLPMKERPPPRLVPLELDSSAVSVPSSPLLWGRTHTHHRVNAHNQRVNAHNIGLRHNHRVNVQNHRVNVLGVHVFRFMVQPPGGAVATVVNLGYSDTSDHWCRKAWTGAWFDTLLCGVVMHMFKWIYSRYSSFMVSLVTCMQGAWQVRE